MQILRGNNNSSYVSNQLISLASRERRLKNSQLSTSVLVSNQLISLASREGHKSNYSDH